MKKKKCNRAWLEENNRDQYVRKARQDRYRSRAVYKLKEIDNKDRIIQSNFSVVDLGAAPGGWSQYVRERIGKHGKVVAVDILPMEPIDQVSFIIGDFTEPSVEKTCIIKFGKNNADLVISDMAPNLTGIRSTDQARSMALAESVLEFVHVSLKPGGDLLIKLFEGTGISEFRASLQQCFARVLTRKPKASRDHSREFYVLARAYGV